MVLWTLIKFAYLYIGIYTILSKPILQREWNIVQDHFSPSSYHLPSFRSSSGHGSRTRGPRDDGFKVVINLDHTSESTAELSFGSSGRRFELEVLLLRKKKKKKNKRRLEIKVFK